MYRQTSRSLAVYFVHRDVVLSIFSCTYRITIQKKQVKIVYIYRAVRQELSTPETGPYTTFGILALRLEAGQRQKVCLIADVSTSRSFAADLADRCTAGQLDPRQLNDVIEDALAF